MIIVAIIGPSGTIVEKALVDTGADDTVFSDVVATRIGIDLTNAPSGIAAGVGPNAAALVRYAEVKLRISDGKEFREWPARVGFTSAQIHRPLLGFAGFLQFFTSIFDGNSESLVLTINSTYAGT
jgi:predicted aspartyl protease